MFLCINGVLISFTWFEYMWKLIIYSLLYYIYIYHGVIHPLALDLKSRFHKILKCTFGQQSLKTQDYKQMYKEYTYCVCILISFTTIYQRYDANFTQTLK